jgi:cyanophycinase
MHTALLKVLNKPVPVGGTSAGMISLGEFIFTAQFDSVYSQDTLQDPYMNGITLGTEFFATPFLNNLVFSSFF